MLYSAMYTYNGAYALIMTSNSIHSDIVLTTITNYIIYLFRQIVSGLIALLAQITPHSKST